MALEFAENHVRTGAALTTETLAMKAATRLTNLLTFALHLLLA
jgi:hypothetical protein